MSALPSKADILRHDRMNSISIVAEAGGTLPASPA
jgi:hypothetical protein